MYLGLTTWAICTFCMAASAYCIKTMALRTFWSYLSDVTFDFSRWIENANFLVKYETNFSRSWPNCWKSEITSPSKMRHQYNICMAGSTQVTWRIYRHTMPGQEVNKLPNMSDILGQSVHKEGDITDDQFFFA